MTDLGLLALVPGGLSPRFTNNFCGRFDGALSTRTGPCVRVTCTEAESALPLPPKQRTVPTTCLVPQPLICPLYPPRSAVPGPSQPHLAVIPMAALCNDAVGPRVLGCPLLHRLVPEHAPLPPHHGHVGGLKLLQQLVLGLGIGTRNGLLGGLLCAAPYGRGSSLRGQRSRGIRCRCRVHLGRWGAKAVSQNIRDSGIHGLGKAVQKADVERDHVFDRAGLVELRAELSADLDVCERMGLRCREMNSAWNAAPYQRTRTVHKLLFQCSSGNALCEA